jgi:hypothetical protein
MRALLREKSWLRVVVDLDIDDDWFRVEYNGRGSGYESVYVNGHVVAQVRSWLWFVPRFDFKLGSHQAAIEVRVWPWLWLRSFQLIVDGWEVCLDESYSAFDVRLSEDRSPQKSSDDQTGIRADGDVQAERWHSRRDTGSGPNDPSIRE